MGGTGEFGPLKSSSVCPATLAVMSTPETGLRFWAWMVLVRVDVAVTRTSINVPVRGSNNGRGGASARAGSPDWKPKLVGLFVRTIDGSVIVWSMDAAPFSLR